MDWNQIVQKITPYVVMIETPSGHGTGFLCLYNEAKTFCGIATADHVIAHADDWQQPIRIHHHATGTQTFLKEDGRVILRDKYKDSAVILTDPSQLKFPESLIPLLPVETRLPVGTEVGWIGYPGVIRHTQCFFSGNVSAFQDYRHAYLIDGVAINGVSGGPVLYSTPTDGIQIIGSISAYIVNRATGEALPGLSVAQDVSHLHETATQIKNLDEARKRQEAEAQKQQAQPQQGAGGAPVPAPAPPVEPVAPAVVAPPATAASVSKARVKKRKQAKKKKG